MKCQILFSGKNKKNISKCRLLKILPRVLSVKQTLLADAPALSPVHVLQLIGPFNAQSNFIDEWTSRGQQP